MVIAFISTRKKEITKSSAKNTMKNVMHLQYRNWTYAHIVPAPRMHAPETEALT